MFFDSGKAGVCVCVCVLHIKLSKKIALRGTAFPPPPSILFPISRTTLPLPISCTHTYAKKERRRRREYCKNFIPPTQFFFLNYKWRPISLTHTQRPDLINNALLFFLPPFLPSSHLRPFRNCVAKVGHWLRRREKKQKKCLQAPQFPLLLFFSLPLSPRLFASLSHPVRKFAAGEATRSDTRI